MLVCCAILFNVVYFFYEGFIPRPFFHDTNDTFMDWYNAAYWVYHPDAYVNWLSVYPPFSFVFLRFFSEPSCYSATELVARSCDPIGRLVLPGFVLLNLILVFIVYRRDARTTAIPRTIALGIGMPMLFAWERGNLIIPCFTFFILGHGRLLKAAWVRWLCVAASVNFKPYLVLSLAGRLVRRQWRWMEKTGTKLVLAHQPNYPALLLEISDPPEMLFVRGTLLPSDSNELAREAMPMPGLFNIQPVSFIIPGQIPAR